MPSIEDKLVLVVDDEADVRKFLGMALTDVGFQVDTAEDGFEALEKVKQRKPDLISLDLVMPKRSGAKFYRDLQKNAEWAKIPVLIVTGHARDDLGKADLEELTMSGPGVYLEKPVKPHNFIAAVKKILDIDNGVQSVPEEEILQKELESLLPDEEKIKLKSFIESADKEILRKLIENLKSK